MSPRKLSSRGNLDSLDGFFFPWASELSLPPLPPACRLHRPDGFFTLLVKVFFCRRDIPPFPFFLLPTRQTGSAIPSLFRDDDFCSKKGFFLSFFLPLPRFSCWAFEEGCLFFDQDL